jgi:hypothetical protein
MTTKTQKTKLFIGVLFAVLITSVGFNTVNADPVKNNSDADSIHEKLQGLEWYSAEYFDIVKRDSLSDVELMNAKQIALSDTRITNMLKSNSLKINDIGFIGNPTEVPVKWDPVLHTTIEDQSVSIRVDLENDEVVKIDSIDTNYLESSGADENAYAVSEYTGYQSTITGIEMVSPTQPTGYTGDGSTHGFVAHLVNAMMSGSVRNDVCTPSEVEDSYWMQAGTFFNEDGWAYVFADTDSGVDGCEAVPIPLSAPSTNDDIRFTIYTSGSTWYALFYNLDDPELEYEFDTDPSSGNMVTDTDGTSVFMENNYESTGWTSQFADTALSITDAQVRTTGSTWVAWNTESEYVLDCNGSTQTNDVITGSLTSGGTSTWDVEDMEDWEAC